MWWLQPFRPVDEAQSRDWCGEYDAVVAQLNRALHVALPMRESDIVGVLVTHAQRTRPQSRC
jgi:hypothetical protein